MFFRKGFEQVSPNILHIFVKLSCSQTSTSNKILPSFPSISEKINKKFFKKRFFHIEKKEHLGSLKCPVNIGRVDARSMKRVVHSEKMVCMSMSSQCNYFMIMAILMQQRKSEQRLLLYCVAFAHFLTRFPFSSSSPYLPAVLKKIYVCIH